MKRIERVTLAFTLLLAGAIAGCAEARPNARDAGGGGDTGASTDTGPGADAGPAADAGHTGGGLVVNEIEATGTEWAELLNTGTAPVDLSALRVTDDAMGMPSATHLTPFPSGVVLHAGERLVLLTGIASPMSGLATGADCMLTGVSSCLQLGFGLSNSNGDALYVLASDDSVVASAVYPAMAVSTGQSYCRLPDGSGALSACTPTPGAANAP
jgi:hypothetical protein